MKKFYFLISFFLFSFYVLVFAQIPTNGLVAYYPFNGNANDESGNGHNGTVYGTTLTIDRFGNPNKAYSFNGINNYISLGTWFNYNDFTISIWVKPDIQNNGIEVIIDNNHSSTSNWVCQHYDASDDFDFAGVPKFKIPANKWSHLILQSQGTAKRVYIDGKLISSANVAFTLNRPPNMNLGYWIVDIARYWKGIMDDARFYNRALDSLEISKLYNEGSKINIISPNGFENLVQGQTKNITWTRSDTTITNVKLEYTTNNGTNWLTIASSVSAITGIYNWTVPNTLSKLCKIKISDVSDATKFDLSDTTFSIVRDSLEVGLVAYYPFNGNANDESGNGNNGTVNGATLTTDRFGNPNKAYSFNGIDEIINITTNNGFPSGSYPRSIVLWFKVINGGTADQHIFSYGYNSQGQRVSVLIQPSQNKVGIETFPTFVYYNWTADTNWHCFTAVYPQGETQTDKFILYHDGIQQTKYIINGVGILNTVNSSQTIGRCQAGPIYFFKGKIDDVRLYNRALTYEEILKLYSEGNINLTSPNGGQTFFSGTLQNITWQIPDQNITNIKIEYTTNNGTSWSIIANNISSNLGTYQWLIPPTPSTQCKVKISDANNSSNFDISDSTFTIKVQTGEWITNLTISDQNISKNISFGQLNNATNGLDTAYGEYELPPIPPVSVFDARFDLPVIPLIQSLKDFRNSSLKSIDWVFRFQPGLAGYPMTISWDPQSLPDGIFRLKDIVTGNIIDVNMKTQSSLQVTSIGINALKIECRKIPNTPIIRFPIDNSVNNPVRLKIIWDSVLYTTNYHLQVSTDSLFTNLIINDSLLITNLKNIGPIEYLTSYYVRVRAINEIGSSNWSQIIKFTTLPAPLWSNNLMINDNCNGVGNLYFGVSTIATNGIDSLYGEYELPPIPPTGNFDNRFDLPTTPIIQSLTDFRNNSQQITNWVLRFQPNSCGMPMIIKWDSTKFPIGIFKLKDNITGNIINVNMKLSGSIVITNSAINNLTIEYLKVPNPPLLVQPVNNSTNVPIVYNFRWQTVSDKLNYWLQVATDSSFNNRVVDDTNLTISNKNIGPLIYSQTYYWRVKVRNEAGYSEWSNIWRFSTPQSPLWYSNLRINDNCNGNGGLVFGIATNATNGIDSLYGEYELPPSPPTGIFDTRFDLPTNPIMQSYIDIRSSNLNSANWNFRFQPGTCEYPITIQWDSSALPIGSFILKDLVTGNVVNIDMKLQSKYVLSNSAITMLKIEYYKEPIAPTLISPTNNAINQPVILKLKWNSVETATNYWLQVARDSLFSNMVISDSLLNVTTKQIGPLSFGQNYFWRVKAKNTIGYGQWSTIWKFSTPPTPVWQNIITINDNCEGLGNIIFGMADLATPGIDSIYGEYELPPQPPSGIFDARFNLPTTPIVQSLIDFRNSTLKTSEWIFKFQSSTCGYPIILRWDSTSLPSGNFELHDLVTGNIVNVNMKKQSSLIITNTAINILRIEYTVCKDISVNAGWNIISIPLNPYNKSKNNIFPTATSPAYEYDNGYQLSDSLKNGKGYWLKFDSQQNLSVCGLFVSTNKIPVITGWNLIGVYDKDVLVSSVTSTPPNIIGSAFFYFNNGYQTPDILNSGRGFWIKVNQNGTLNLPLTTFAKATGDVTRDEGQVISDHQIIVTDNLGNSQTLYMTKEAKDMTMYELPPIPPAGIFDSRFSNDRYLANINEQLPNLNINSASYPVRIKVIGTSLTIKDVITGKIIDKTIKDGEEFILSNPQINRFKLSAIEIPAEYSLSQNYPNPFNPKTIINYQLPINNQVTIKIFDIMGRLVETLVDELQEPGKYTIEWNANKYSTGIYYYELKAGDYRAIKKMMLVK